MGDHVQTVQKKYTFGKAMSVDADRRRLTAVVTVRQRDRDGDLVEPAGMDFQEFMQNPVVLLWHDKQSLPVAKVLDMRSTPDALLADVEFADTATGREVFKLYEGGFLNAWSPGFTAARDDVEPILDENGMVSGLHIMRSKIHELSVAPVPANPGALTKTAGSMTPEVRDFLVKGYQTVREPYRVDGLEDMETELGKAFGADDHTNEIDENEPSWGSVNKETLPIVAFTWEKTGTDPEKKGTWDYAHHWVKSPGEPNDFGVVTSGTLLLHQGGLRAAWVKALETRGETEADREVLNHLQFHRKAIGLDKTDRPVHYYETTPEGGRISREKDFDKLEEGETPFEVYEKTLRPSAFKMSVSERGEAGKIPVSVVIGEKFAVKVEFQAIQETDDEIVEAKVLKVGIEVPAGPTEDRPDGAMGRTEGEVVKEKAKTGGSASLVEVDNLLAELSLEIETLGMSV